MPLVNVRLIESVFTPEQKSEIIHGITEAMVAVEGEALRGVTWVVRGGPQRRLGYRWQGA